MNKTKRVIELNGKRYDATNGSVLTPVTSASSKKGLDRNTAGGPIDGFFKAPRHLEPKPVRAVSKRTTSKGVAAHKPQRSSTLVRLAVKKPASSLLGKAAIPLDATASNDTSSLGSGPASLLGHISRARLHRAHEVNKSRFISKFSSQTPALAKKSLPLAVHAVPAHAKGAKISSQAALAHAPSQSYDPLAGALERATSHQQQPFKKSRVHHRVARKLGISTKVLLGGVSAIVVLLAGGWFAYQKVPVVALRIASAHAGFHATLPAYQPAGFSLAGPVEYSAGQVTLSYRSNSDQRQFKITQQPSNWNSETLQHSLVSSNQPYQTIEKNGQTIYVQGSNAVTVNEGKKCEVKGDKASLSPAQLMELIQNC